MRFRFEVEVEVERVEGKFATRDEIAETIAEWLDSANAGSVDDVGADSASIYEITSWEVEVAR